MKVWGGGDGASTIMEFCTVEEYSIVFSICVSSVAVKNINGSDKGSGSVLYGGSFEDAWDGNPEGVRPGEGDTLGFS